MSTLAAVCFAIFIGLCFLSGAFLILVFVLEWIRDRRQRKLEKRIDAWLEETLRDPNVTVIRHG